MVREFRRKIVSFFFCFFYLSKEIKFRGQNNNGLLAYSLTKTLTSMTTTTRFFVYVINETIFMYRIKHFINNTRVGLNQSSVQNTDKQPEA